MIRGGSQMSRLHFSAAYVLLLAALLAAAVALVVLPQHDAPAPTGLATLTPSPTPSDEHAFTTDEGVLSFHFEADAIVIRRTVDGQTTILATATVSTAPAPSGGGVIPTGTAAFAMVCPSAGGGEPHRYIFGTTDFGAALTYTGPDAIGRAVSDGPFLFALKPGAIPPGTEIQLRTVASGTQVGDVVAGFSGAVFDRASTDGTLQPSGCWVTG